MDEETIKLIQLLLARLEHISADSVWAHRASGIRGSLFKALENLENGGKVSGSQQDALLFAGFHIIEKVAKENVHHKFRKR